MRCQVCKKRLLLCGGRRFGPLADPRYRRVAYAAGGVVCRRLPRGEPATVVHPLAVEVGDVTVGKEFIPTRWCPQRPIGSFVSLHAHSLAFHVMVLAKHACQTPREQLWCQI